MNKLVIGNFNPNVTVQVFQQSIIEEERRIREAAFAALALSSETELVAGLTAAQAQRVRQYSSERKERILGYVQGLNKLGDMKDKLIDTHPTYKAFKEVKCKVMEAYSTLSWSMPEEELSQLQIEVPAILEFATKYKTNIKTLCHRWRAAQFG